jgi:L-ascorbate metabolism protein UlaG (beta-lactamase superfamily)
MNISWLGQTCFKLQSKDVVLITDPYAARESGLKLPPLKADIVVACDPIGDVKPITRPEQKDEEAFSISSPGEYEVKGAFIYGIPHPQGRKTIYRIDMEGMVIAYLGDMAGSLSAEQLEKLSGVDILLVPVGGDGKSSLDGKGAAEVVGQIEPRLVNPMLYKLPGLKNKLEGAEKFCKELGVKMEEPLDKLKIAKKDLPQEDMKVIFLKA